MKICFVSHSAGLGGAERILLETIDVLSERRFACHVLLPGEGELARELHSRGVPIKFIQPASLAAWEYPSLWERAKAAIKIGVAALATARMVREWKCDVVHSNTVTTCHGAIAAKLLGLPHLWHLQEFGEEDQGLIFYFGHNFSCRLFGYLSTVVIVLSKALAGKYGRLIDPSKIAVIYPSMHLADRHSLDADSADPRSTRGDRRFRCVIVGALREGKRQEDAVLAMAHLKQNGVMAELVIVGGGDAPYILRLKEIIREHGLEDRVLMTGQVRDASQFIRDSDALLVCSKSEAFGRVTIEAMLAGKPVIGADGGATPELIRNGENGLLYRVASHAELAEKICHLLEHPCLAVQLGDNGRRWAETVFTRERYASELVRVLGSLGTSLASFPSASRS